MAPYPSLILPNAIPESLEAQLRATATDTLSRWLGIFVTSLTTTHQNSKWRYVRFRGCVNGNKQKIMVARLMTSAAMCAHTACGEKSPKQSHLSCAIQIIVAIQVPILYRRVLERALCKMIPERYGVDYEIFWKTTPSTPYVLPISQTIIKSRECSSLVECSAPLLLELITSTTTDSSTE